MYISLTEDLHCMFVDYAYSTFINRHVHKVHVYIHMFKASDDTV